MDKLNILICAPLPPPKGGIATWVDEILNATNGDDSLDISIFNTANKRMAGVYSHTRRVLDGISLIWSQLTNFSMTIKCSQFTVVHISSSGGFAHFRDILFCIISKFYRKKVVLQLHYGVNDFDYKWVPFSKFFLAICHKVFDRVLTLDPGYVTKLSSSKLALSFNGMNANSHDYIREKEKVILFVGWIIEQKGIFELVQCWNRLPNKNDWMLKIIGPSLQLENRKLIEMIDIANTEYLGELPREQVLKYSSKCSVFALPSHTEGFPYAVLEAMQSGAALLVSKVGGMSQLFEFEKKPGWLVEPKNKEQLTEILNVIVNNDTKVKSYSENSYLLFRNKYTNTHMINNLIENWRLL